MICSHLTRHQSNDLYKSVLKDNDKECLRRLCKEDLFFLLTVACKRKDVDRDWLYERCREVEDNPDGYLDLWSREHYKSTIITYGLTIKDILNDPDVTVGIFSHTRPIAKAFLSQIKREFETNEFLQGLFPDVLYENPSKDSLKWSLDDGIIVRRRSNPKEATVEAWGLVDGQPTSKHYKILIYDDVVTRESVTTPEMIKKVTEAFGLSLNLAADGGVKRFIGTRYHQNDTYKTIISRETAIPRIYPATHNGKMDGSPVLISQKNLEEKLRDMGSYVFSCQMLQNPLEDNAMGFKKEWLEFYNQLNNEKKSNKYIIVDPASEKKKKSDYTVMSVIALGSDKNYYLVDAVRDRLNLTERTDLLFHLVRKWNPNNVGYEKYGLQSDIEHIKYVQEQEGFRFRITELGGSMGKNDRIRRLVPIIENHRFYFPRKMIFISVDGKVHDFMNEFIEEEYDSFPVGTHDDMLDCISRIVDDQLCAVFPKKQEVSVGQKYDPLSLKITQRQEHYNPLSALAK